MQELRLLKQEHTANTREDPENSSLVRRLERGSPSGKERVISSKIFIIEKYMQSKE